MNPGHGIERIDPRTWIERSRPTDIAPRAWIERSTPIAVKWLPIGLTAVAALTVLWTRLSGLDQSMFDDELYSVVSYISPGPSAMWGRYVPNDHVLFELLSWVTVHLTGLRSNATYRFWGVAPAIAAIAVMTAWLRLRRGWWVAAAFAVLAVSAPVHLTYGTQGRGYGLAFLASVLVVIGALTLKEEHSRRAVALFVTGALIGIFALPVFGLAVLAAGVPLLAFREQRRQVLLALGLVGVASAFFYAPVLSQILTQSSQHFGARLPWYGFLTGPLRDQIVPSLQLLFPSAPAGVLGAGAAVGLALGIVTLWRRWERVFVVLFISVPFITYLCLDIGRFYVEARFASFVLLPLLAVEAVGLVEIGYLISRLRGGAVVAAVGAVALSIFALSKIVQLGETDARAPLENTQQAAAILSATGFTEPIVTNSRRTIGFTYYLHGSQHYRVLTPPALVTMFCSTRTAFIYIEHGLHSPLPDTSCLARRRAVREVIPQQERITLALWFVPAEPSSPAPKRSGRRASARRVRATK